MLGTGLPGPSERRGILWRWRGPSGLRWVWRNGRGPHLEGPGSPVPSTPERREGLRACYWEGPSELPERRSSSSAPRRQDGFKKGRGTRDQIANIRWIIEKAREFQKTSISALLTMPKRRGTDTPVHHPEKPAGSSHSSTRGLKLPEQLERKPEFHSSDKTRPDSHVPTLQGQK